MTSLADVQLGFVNTTLLTDLTLELGITRLPGFILYKNGESAGRAVGPSFQELAALTRATFGECVCIFLSFYIY